MRFTTCLLMKHVDLSPSEKTYRERKKCVEKISKDFILQQNYETCRTDYLYMGRKNKHTHEPELYSGWENEATEWVISHRRISADHGLWGHLTQFPSTTPKTLLCSITPLEHPRLWGAHASQGCHAINEKRNWLGRFFLLWTAFLYLLSTDRNSTLWSFTGFI